jgi:hypothetical protein
MMRAFLQEMIKLSGCTDVDALKVRGDETHTGFSAVSEDGNQALYGLPREVYPDLKGLFVIPQMKMFKALLEHAPYQAKDIEIERFERNVVLADQSRQMMEVPKLMKFKDGKGGSAIFHLSGDPKVRGFEPPAEIKFAYSFTPSKDAIKNFGDMAKIFITPECKLVTASVEDNNLMLTFGTVTSSTHSGSMIFEENIGNKLNDGLSFDVSKINATFKTIGDREMTMSLGNNTFLRIKFETELAQYEYWFRAVKKT